MSEMQLFSTMTFPEIYERVLVEPLFRPFAQEVVARLELTRDDRLIDVACGTGIVARLARERLGHGSRIIGVDVAPAMLAVARNVAPTIDWREGNAVSLPVSDGEDFSALACHQGLQFFQDKRAAVREMRRVLAPGGRIAIATWRPLREIPVALELNVVAEHHVGTIVDTRHSFGDADALKELLAGGGFRKVNVETFSHDVKFADGALFARLNAMAVVGMSGKGKALTDAARSEVAERIATDSQAVVDRHTKDGAFVCPLFTNIAVGVA
jgi:ubiquinone/menaquinone biosynthesis C-methylase UbiE